jgi:hypothetical protein
MIIYIYRICGFFRVHFGLHVGLLLRISYQFFFKGFLGFTYGLSRVSFRIQTEKNKAKETEKQRDSKIVKTGSKEAKEQEVEQQKHMTDERKQ